nr:hypothetical protein [Roseomonas nepalensis]
MAGKVFAGSNKGRWVRPVNLINGGSLSSLDRRYKGGAEPAILDVIDIVLTKRCNHDYQPENYQINKDVYWSLVEEISSSQALTFLDPPSMGLWGTNHGSSGRGMNDRVPENLAPSYGSSLRLILVSDLKIRVATEGAAFGESRRSVRGSFTYEGDYYTLKITDPEIEEFYTAGDDSVDDVGKAMLCVSLGELLNGFAYKLSAGIVPL